MTKHGASAPLKDDYLDSSNKFELNLKSQENRVLQAPKVLTNLRTLERDGANLSMILRLLVLSVKNNFPDVKDLLNANRNRLTRLSKQLENLSRDLKAAFSDPTIFSDFWFPILFNTGDEIPDLDRLKTLPNGICFEMGKFSKALHVEERKLAKLVQIHHPKLETWTLAALARHVHESTDGNHDELLADLLQAAHQTLGSRKRFSGPSFRKFRQRNAPETITPRKIRSGKLSTVEMLTAMGLWDNSTPEN